MKESTKIKCPKCGTEIDVNEILSHQIEDRIEKENEQKIQSLQDEFELKQKALDDEKVSILKEKADIGAVVNKQVQQQLTTEKAKLNKELKEQLESEHSESMKLLKAELDAKTEQVKELNKSKSEIEKLKREKEELRDAIILEQEQEYNKKLETEKAQLQEAVKKQLESNYADQLKVLKEELDAKSEQVKELNKTKAEIERLTREKEELRESISLEKERELTVRIEKEKTRIQTQVEESNEMKFRELEKKLDDQKKLAEEMKRKAEQGSMQLQGEVQELAIEDILNNMFHFDEIKDVPKGVKGADVIHTVRNKQGSDCGVILYESKRTKAFNREWITKLKSDAVLVKADMCILVSEVLPDGVDKVGLIDGVWVCTYHDFKSLVLVIRENVIKISEAYASQTNSGEKMQMLYNYLTSNEFLLQIGAIVDGFNSLHKGYVQERNAMEKIWKQREKQLEKVLINTNHFIGSVKGIAGISVQTLPQIENDAEVLESIE
ncbi:MAG: DUF2130 domain-containing protein [Candidatus Cloacimonas sp.]|jgi:hypothetical protein|nr:DUF2130 domain-containing protein [Candidatus Cloacimonas sp.]